MTLSGMWIILIVSVLQLLVVVVIIAAIGNKRLPLEGTCRRMITLNDM